MATYRVNIGVGNDANTGAGWSAATALATFTRAKVLAAANTPGPHTILVSGPNSSNTITEYVLFTGDADLDGCVIYGLSSPSDSASLATEDSVIIDIQAGNHGIYLNQIGIELAGFTLKNSDATHYGIYGYNVANLNIHNNFLVNNGLANILMRDCANFVIHKNYAKGLTAKSHTLKTQGTCSGRISYNRFGPSLKYSNGYVNFFHSSGSVNAYNNDITGSYAMAVLHDGAGTTNFINNKCWANQASSYNQKQIATANTIQVTAGIFNYDYNYISGSGLRTTASVSGGTDGGHNVIDTDKPGVVLHNFNQGFLCFTFDDYGLTNFETFAGVIKSYGGYATMFVVGHIKSNANYQARLRALIADGHAIQAHSYSHTDINVPGANEICKITYTGTGADPHILLTAGDAAGSIVLSTSDTPADDYTFNFTTTHTIKDFVTGSGGKVTIGAGGTWVLSDIANFPTIYPAAPNYSTDYLKWTSLAAADKAVPASPLTTTIEVTATDNTTGFYKDEFVDWKAELETITDESVTVFSTPRALTYATGIYTLIENAGYDGCRGDIDIAGGESYIDMRQLPIYRIATITSTDLIANAAVTEANVRKQARRLAIYMKDNPVIVCPIWHGIDDAVLTSDQLGWFCDEMQQAGVSMVTMPYAVNYIRTSGDWTDTAGVWTNLTMDLAENHKLLADSACVNTGLNTPWSTVASISDMADYPITNAAGEITAFMGTVDIGAYEWVGGGGGLSPGLGLSGGNRPPWWHRRRR